MTREQVLVILESYLATLTRIKALDEEITTIQNQLITYGNVIGDGMPHASSGESDAKYVKQVNRIYDSNHERLNELNALIDQKEAVLKLINLAPTRRGRDILEMRYRYGMSVKRISEEINRSDTNIRAIQNRAINSIARATEGECV